MTPREAQRIQRKKRTRAQRKRAREVIGADRINMDKLRPQVATYGWRDEHGVVHDVLTGQQPFWWKGVPQYQAPRKLQVWYTRCRIPLAVEARSFTAVCRRTTCFACMSEVA